MSVRSKILITIVIYSAEIYDADLKANAEDGGLDNNIKQNETMWDTAF